MTEQTTEQPPAAAEEFKAPASQEELNRIIGERVARERAKYADYAEAKAAAKRLAEIEEANASELEKAVKRARQEGAAEVTDAANRRLVAAEARAAAAELRFRNPGLAVKAIDLGEVKVSEDGTVDAAAIKARLADLAKDEPYLVDDGKAGVARPKPDEAQGRGTGKPNAVEDGRAEARRRYGLTAGAQQ